MSKEYDLEAVRAQIEKSPFDWTAEENGMTKLSEAERNRYLGVPLPPREKLDEMIKAAEAQQIEKEALAASSAAALPAAFNLNNIAGQSYVSGITNQGGCGSCVAFGVAATLEGTARYTRRMPRLEIDLSEAHLFYGWAKSEGRNCDNGWWPINGLRFSTDRGVTYEVNWPYTAGNTNGGSLPATWESHRAKSAGLVNLTGNIAGIKQHLNSFGPVAACFIVYDDFYALGSGVYRRTSNVERGGHCVAIVGYDDAQQAWICKNSWGTSHGDKKGFFLMGYGQCLIETWQVVGVQGVNLRTWTGNKKVVGLWSSGHELNAHAYIADYGWIRIGGNTQIAHHTLLNEIANSKLLDHVVNVYNNDGVISTVYAY
ncbi:MAG: C1 family peptidase [Ancrocorticia sp.]